APVRPQLAIVRRGIFPPLALCGVALEPRPRQRARGPRGGVLSPSLGDRSGPAARAGSLSQIGISPLPQPRAHGAPPRTPARGLRLGRHGRGLPGRPAMTGARLKSLLFQSLARFLSEKFSPAGANWGRK